MAQQEPAGFRSEPREQESAASLLGRLVDDATALVRHEVALAKAEFTEAIASVKTGMRELAFGCSLLLAGALALLAAVILALSKVMEPWLAAGLVGVIVAIAGFALLQNARRKLNPSALKPERTRESLRRDAQVVARRTP